MDIGSFVSPKAIPQLKDTAELIKKLDILETKTELMVLVANNKGGEIASSFEEIKHIIYPFSISPTFLKRNINSDIENSLQCIDFLRNICLKTNKNLVVYVAMGFGNPYGDEWNIELAEKYVEILKQKEIKIIPFSDILGNSTPEKITLVFSNLISKFPEIEFGFHLHARPDDWYGKINAAYISGCNRFDSVINGLGGCPMADDKLLGNMDTRNLLYFFDKNKIEHKLNINALNIAVQKAQQIF